MKRTGLGKFLAKQRIDNGDNLADMAGVLSISKAQLSAIELGNRSVLKPLRDSLIKRFKAEFSEEYISWLIDISQNSIKLKLTGVSELNRETTVQFNNKLPELDDLTCKKIQAVILAGNK